MASGRISVLVVDDDVRILRMMQHILELKGYRALCASDAHAAISLLCEEMPNLVLLDVMLPDMDGYTLCRRIREFSQVSIIIVTAKDKEEDRIQGLNAGADDYITKPFSPKELLARVRAVLRRARLSDEPPEPAFQFEDLVIDFVRREVFVGDHEVNLTATEYRLLSYLVRNAGRVVTPDQILEQVWGEEYAGETHLLQVNMGRLRQKLGDDARNSRYIFTRPGIGYMLAGQTRA